MEACSLLMSSLTVVKDGAVDKLLMFSREQISQSAGVCKYDEHFTGVGKDAFN